ncbi:hypothetical protein GCK72_023655 [Caenorhabditis remanei]|uniref:Uncharacterized protein n=1 Tax=Caenorhabditis remanei TaxID=31234 RepID=A0A6A5FXJ4_CAERE|nr:hypothetical protein GCK72_023655 [Caenorhabditis remanei]KAF1747194.1 hypothetical protein GCK72_023655 [Caenorhabditis remanei]
MRLGNYQKIKTVRELEMVVADFRELFDIELVPTGCVVRKNPCGGRAPCADEPSPYGGPSRCDARATTG